MLIAEIALASDDVAATSSRLAKIRRLADVLRAAAPDEVATVVAWLSGELPQRQIGVGWAALRGLPTPAVSPTLTVGAVDTTFSAIGAESGVGSQAVAPRCCRGCSKPQPARNSCSSVACSAANCAKARWAR